MSMSFSVYVGPYLRVTGIDRAFVEKWERVIRDGHGELGVGEDAFYLIPNAKITGIDRQLTFDRQRDANVIDSFDSWKEHHLIRKLIDPVIADLPPDATCYVSWGIVPCLM